MSEPTLSIIVPAWNEEKYVGRAVDSLRRAAQAYERERGCTAEIIVVDNNSQDRTGDVAREHGAQVVLVPGTRDRTLAERDAERSAQERGLDVVRGERVAGGVAGWIVGGQTGAPRG